MAKSGIGKTVKSWAVLPGEGLHTPGAVTWKAGVLRLRSPGAEQDRAQDSGPAWHRLPSVDRSTRVARCPLLSSCYVSGVLLVTGPVISLHPHQDKCEYAHFLASGTEGLGHGRGDGQVWNAVHLPPDLLVERSCFSGSRGPASQGWHTQH